VGKILLWVLAALLLAWQVVKTSAVGALIRRSPGAAAAVSINDPRVGIAIGMAEFQVGNGRVSPEGQRRLAAALAHAPLAEEPFVVQGVLAIAGGQADRGLRLLEEAKRRNPRSRVARLVLLDRYLRAKRLPEAGVEISVLNRLIARAGEALVPELARMATEPGTGPVLIGVLAREPGLQQAVFQHLAAGKIDPDQLLRLTRAAGAAPAAAQPWQAVLLDRLVAKGDFGRAVQLWRGFTGLPDKGGEKAVYDGSFRGLPGPAPFNWSLSSTANGVAERTNGPALQIDYYGRADTDLASQLLVLGPGQHRLQFKVQGDAKGDGSRLEWTVTCAAGGGELLRLPITDTTYSPRAMTGTFTVPSGCGAQWLRLKGIAGEVPTGQNAVFSEVAVAAGGRP
jgi:hypothetical protein